MVFRRETGDGARPCEDEIIRRELTASLLDLERKGMDNVIYAFGFFYGIGDKIKYFERLDEQLKHHGYRLILVDEGDTVPETSCEAVACPPFVARGQRILGDAFFSNDDLTPDLLYAGTLDAELRQKSLAAEVLRSLLFISFVRERFIKQPPTLCLLWHQFNGRHHALAAFCRERHIPYFFVEYGSMPGTIAFDLEGQMAESRVTRESEVFAKLPVDEADREVARQMVEMASQGKKTRKSQASSIDIPAITASYKAQGRKVIFYAGQNDWASGILPQAWPDAKIHSPLYADTLDALGHLSVLAEKNNWQVLFKPHPLVQDRHREYTVEYPERISLVVGANMFACIECADACATILSQAAYHFLIHGKACVLLGRNQLSGKGCVYEPSAKGDVERCFQEALKKGFAPEQREQFMTHAAQLCRYYLFALDDETAAVMGRDADLAAERLTEYVRGGNPPGGFPFYQDVARGPAWKRLRGPSNNCLRSLLLGPLKKVRPFVERAVKPLPRPVYVFLQKSYHKILHRL